MPSRYNSLVQNMRIVLCMLFAAMFMAVQSMALAHAAEHLDAPHEHNGVVCDIGFIHADVDPVMPPSPQPPVLIAYEIPRAELFFVTQAVRSYQCRAPPGRGPPLFSI